MITFVAAVFRYYALLGKESSIIYAQGFSTISSVIAALSKRGDIIVAVDGSNFAVQNGTQISPGNIKRFKHSDMADLERVLESLQREGLRHNYSIILDESNSFGVLGRTGLGLSEVFDIPAKEGDMIVVSMVNALSLNGEFCAGPKEVID
ncbi:serine palmitoyltransferase component [Mortierella alpina]|nr:serine palmitoyltransferase component [Mortierella alpina]